MAESEQDDAPTFEAEGETIAVEHRSDWVVRVQAGPRVHKQGIGAKDIKDALEEALAVEGAVLVNVFPRRDLVQSHRRGSGSR